MNRPLRIVAGIMGLLFAVGTGEAQPVALPPAPAGVQTFSAEGTQFSRVRAANVSPFVPTNGPLARPLGGGSWDFGIGRAEVTQGQFVEFINAFNAVPVPTGQPWSRDLDLMFNGIGWVGPGTFGATLGPLGRFVFASTELGANRPVAGMGFYGAALYTNWIESGRRDTLEAITNGVYDLRQWSGDVPATWPGVVRRPGARFWLPSYDEWVVAGFYDRNRFGTDQSGWWTHLSSRDRNPVPGPPGVGETSAGWDPPGGPIEALLLPIASYQGSQSPWGVLDMSGTFSEFLEEQWPFGFGRLYVGTQAGPFNFPDLEVLLEQPGWVGENSPNGGPFSFRLATSVVPAPSTVLLIVPLFMVTPQARRKRCDVRSRTS